MNFSQMGASVARLLRQVPGTNGLYTSADLSAVINDANLDVAKDLNILQSMGEVYTQPSVYQYALSATYMAPDLLSVWKVLWNNMPLNKASFGDSRWSTSSPKTEGTPRVYRIWNNKIEIDPTPQESYPLQLYHTYKPSTLAMSTAETELPSEAHMAIVYRACAYLTIKDEKEMRYNAFFGKYQYELTRLRALTMGFDGSDVIPQDPANSGTLINWNSQY